MKSKRFMRLGTGSNKTHVSAPTGPGWATVGDSHEVPFYRVNALSTDGFIEGGSKRNEGGEDAFPR